MWTSHVYGHHDKMARTKTHRISQNTEYTKTQQTLRKHPRIPRGDSARYINPWDN